MRQCWIVVDWPAIGYKSKPFVLELNDTWQCDHYILLVFCEVSVLHGILLRDTDPHQSIVACGFWPQDVHSHESQIKMNKRQHPLRGVMSLLEDDI